MKYVALLRGVNVGGKNVLLMSELKSCFEGMGFEYVSTHIQSGNVLFSSKEDDLNKLTERIEDVLSKNFDYKSCMIVVSHEQLKKVITRAPAGFGSDLDSYRYDVIFLKEPLSTDNAMKSIKVKEGVDQVFAGPGVLYFSGLINKARQSRLSRIVMMPIYQSMTIRNWNTAIKLFSIMNLWEEGSASV